MGMVSFNIEKPCPQFLIGFLLLNIYLPGIIGASIPTGWLFLLIILPLFLFQINIDVKFSHILGFLFLLYAALSFVWTANLNIALMFFLQFVALSLVFCIGSSIKNIKWFLVGLGIGLLPSDIIATIQYFYHYPVVFTLPLHTAGLFINQNMFCEASAVLFVTLLIFEFWWILPLTLPGLIYVHSRAAIIGVIVGTELYLFKKNKLYFYIFNGFLMLCFLVTFRNFTFSSVIERFNIWLDVLNGFNIFGNGVGSFEITYPFYATHIDTALARPKFAHNDLLQLMYEYGIGFVFFAIFVFSILKVRKNENIILVSILTISLFSFPLHIPVIAFIWFLVAGFVSRDMPSIWNIRDSGGLHLSEGFTRC